MTDEAMMALCDRLEACLTGTAAACWTGCGPRRWRPAEVREMEAAE
jgi:hypothetical protein